MLFSSPYNNNRKFGVYENFLKVFAYNPLLLQAGSDSQRERIDVVTGSGEIFSDRHIPDGVAGGGGRSIIKVL